MKEYKIDCFVSYDYGAWSLRFYKELSLPFAPFFGLVITDHDTDNDAGVEVELNNHDYLRTYIGYNPNNRTFEINVHYLWKGAVSEERIDNIINSFSGRLWGRADQTDVNELKAVMNRKSHP